MTIISPNSLKSYHLIVIVVLCTLKLGYSTKERDSLRTDSISKSKILQSFSYRSSIGNLRLSCTSSSLNFCEQIVIKTDNNEDNSSSSSSSSKKSSLDSLKWYILPFEFVLLVVLILLFIMYFKKASDLKRKMKELNISMNHKDRTTTNITNNVEEVEDRRSSSSTGILLFNNNKSNIVNNDNHDSRQEMIRSNRQLVFFSDDHDFEMSNLLKASAEGLGQGSFGNCYKVVMEGKKQMVVVRRLKNLRPFTSEEFERQMLMVVVKNKKHPNLLPLLAYFNSDDEKLLVHNYVQQGNLFHRLHGGRVKNGSSSENDHRRIPFRWSSRLNVARGVARAMSHLHKDASLLVPHGNLKSTNVLLHGPAGDDPLVSDYGLSSLVSLPVAAHRAAAYRSPEFHSGAGAANRLSRKSDVWTFGCLVLELVTGKVAAHAAPPGVRGIDLGAWAKKTIREEWTAEVLDLEILAGMRRGEAIPAAVIRLLEIGLMCVEWSPEKRPEMADVERMVEEIQLDGDSEDQGDDVSSFDRSVTDDSTSFDHSVFMHN